jgi:hypothetical protein
MKLPEGFKRLKSYCDEAIEEDDDGHMHMDCYELMEALDLVKEMSIELEKLNPQSEVLRRFLEWK